MSRESRGAREVVEERGVRPVGRRRLPASTDSRSGTIDELIERLDRPLRAGIVAAERLDRVADELEPDRLGLAGGKDVEDAAADGELAVLVGRILAVKPASTSSSARPAGRCPGPA